MKKKAVVFVALLGLAGAMSLGASAQGENEGAYQAKKAGCEQQADARDFGIHFSQRHRFVVRCVAGLSQR
jgi:hypothetical protein